ncbi:hypothetical protein V6N13_079063 [Hibiscus sabdariffa]
MLKRLVDRATSTTESSREVDIDLDALVSEEPEEIRQSLENEVPRLTQTEGEKREKEEQVARCEDGVELPAIYSQRGNAPLYGAGL